MFIVPYRLLEFALTVPLFTKSQIFAPTVKFPVELTFTPCDIETLFFTLPKIFVVPEPVISFVTVRGINLLSDSKTEKTYIPFAYDSFKDKVQTNITEVGKGVENPYQTTTFAPIYKYNVSYNPSNGYFLFSRGGGQSSADFNPAVLSSAVNSQVGAYSAANRSV